MKICTWNIKFGLGLPSILKTIRSHQEFHGLDFFAIQESSAHKNVEDARIIANELGREYDFFQVNTHRMFGHLQANAIIWNTNRVYISKKESFLLPKAQESKIPQWEKTFLRLIPKQQRNALVLEGTIEDKKIRIYVSHLDVVGFTHRRNQLNTIFLDNLLRSATDITCIAGDFNTIRFKKRPTWQAFVEDTKKQGFIDLTTEITWTFSEPRLRMKQKLDAIFLKPSHLIYTSQSLEVPGSDHIPVFANITLP